MTLTSTRLALDIVKDVAPTISVQAATGAKVEGTGSVVVEVLDAGPGPTNTGRFITRRIRVNVLADVSRLDGLPLKDDADRRAWATWEAIDARLNDVDHRTAYASCTRANGPALSLLPNGDGAVLLVAEYEVTT